MRHTLLAIAFFSLAARPSRAQRPDLEVWVGGTNVLGAWNYTELVIGAAPTLEVRAAETGPLAVSSLARRGDSVSFRVATPRGTFAFDGVVSADTMRGRLVGPGAAGELRLVRTAPTLGSASAVGRFRLSDGTMLETTPRPFGQLAAFQIATKNGTETVQRSFRLLPRPDGAYFTSGSVASALKADEIVRLDDAGRVTWSVSGAVARTGTRVDAIAQETVSLAGPAGRLTGTLLRPSVVTRSPAVVLVHGSGAITRDNLYVRARALVGAGLAVLVFDKRGVGESDGAPWTAATLDDLAADALAGVRYLRARPDIDSTRVGLQGHSQGAWIAPLAAARSRDVAFLLLTSGGIVAPGEQEAYRAGAQAKRAGLSEADAARATEFMRLKWRYAAGAESWARYASALESARTTPWLRFAEGPADSSSSEWRFLRELAAFDPRVAERAIRVPTLVLLGDDDDEVPARTVADGWRALFASPGHDGSEVRAIAHADHGLFTRTDGSVTTLAREPGEAIAHWLRATLGVP